MQGVNVSKVEKALREKKVHEFYDMFAGTTSNVHLHGNHFFQSDSHDECMQVPPVDFTFIDINHRKGLSEDTACLA